MSWVQIHLATNHLPVIGLLVGLAILAVGLFWRSADLKRFSLYFFVFLGLATLLVYFTGEPAAEAVEQLPGIAHDVIERHEDASIYGLILVEILAIFSLIGLVQWRLALRGWYFPTLLALVLLTTATIGWIASLGGKIRHEEIAHVNHKAQADSFLSSTTRSAKV